jgi:predicted RNase H-like nuclease
MTQARPVDDAVWVGGADGCAAGWAVVLLDVGTGTVRHRLLSAFAEVLRLPEAPVALGVDMVIGLPDRAERGGRACDRAARRLLGRRGSSVFSPPARPALNATSYDEALTLNRAHSPDGVGLSIQTYHLLPKMREVDALLTPARQARIVEVHPELSFLALNDGAPLPSKHTPKGRAAREGLLAGAGFPDIASAVAACTGPGVKADDWLDAHAVCWTARRRHAGRAQRLPDVPPTDARGLRMEIWR